MKTAAVAVLVCLSRLAAADEITLDRTCVEIDAQDGLTAADRDPARAVVRQVLEREHLFVVLGACTETFVVSHERTDTGYVIRMRSSAGKRRMTVPSLDDVSIKYQKLARSLLDAKAAQQQPPLAPHLEAAPGPTATPRDDWDPHPAVDVSYDQPDTVESTLKRNIWYATLGAEVTGGSGFSVGFRRAFQPVSLDLAFSLRISDGGAESTTFGAELLRYKLLSPAVKAFIGGGLSAGSIKRGDPTVYYGDSRDFYWGEGIHGELTAGFHVGKAHGMQLLTQLDITLPFYRLGNDDGMKDYAAAAVVSGGLGF
ncbi:MAG TPA: hypothetical protein VIV11_32330 [Kofleriaceae bacterium]